MDTSVRVAISIGAMAFAALMTYAMTIQLRIWHVLPW
jgi:hypothetical protein